MPVKIRLTRRGRKKLAIYDVVVADSRAPRDGKFIEKIGTFNPNINPALVDLNFDKAVKWVLNGAQPTDTARTILSDKGVMLKKHLQIGVLKGAITQEQADKKFQDWVDSKENADTKRSSDLASKKETAKKERLEAESKVNIARQEAIKAKAAAAIASAEPVATEGEAGEAQTTTEPAAE